MKEEAYIFHPVWDPILRGLHWWNALTLFLQIITGSIILAFGEGLREAPLGTLINIHTLFGYLFAAGLFTRILWLFIGPPTARWWDLLPLTARQRMVLMDTLRYYVSLLRGTPPLYLAHNPFAGIVYLLFFLLAGIQVVTGVVTLNTPEDLRGGSLAFGWHGIGYYLVIFYIVAHISAVFIHEWAERHGLIGAMIHGSKTFTDEEWERLNPSNSKGGVL